MSEEILAGLKKIMKEVKPEVELSAGKNLREDLGLDSLDIISFLFEVEKHFAIEIPEEDISEYELLELDKFIKYTEKKAKAK
jgi:acyl carrier protein